MSRPRKGSRPRIVKRRETLPFARGTTVAFAVFAVKDDAIDLASPPVEITLRRSIAERVAREQAEHTRRDFAVVPGRFVAD